MHVLGSPRWSASFRLPRGGPRRPAPPEPERSPGCGRRCASWSKPPGGPPRQRATRDASWPAHRRPWRWRSGRAKGAGAGRRHRGARGGVGAHRRATGSGGRGARAEGHRARRRGREARGFPGGRAAPGPGAGGGAGGRDGGAPRGAWRASGRERAPAGRRASAARDHRRHERTRAQIVARVDELFGDEDEDRSRRRR